jgi:ribosomal protein L29
MSIQELRQLTPKKLLKELQKAVRSLAVIRFHVKTGQNQNVAEVKKTRQTIARIKTLLNSSSQTPTSQTK